ncbi:FecR domain-containing protein [Caulobacter sp.]|uniref:FecR family protein n=1 Tax=Caulobacter sp. TaxID=78 RepID=UPI001B2156A7|nr:FecR domain-containing protein [Caulobacter sp.]MBO9547117.1 FecR domain-containing protein [Caulobacter sp.]
MISGTEEQLRQEAAGWFARMRGPGAEAARAEFDQWRAAPDRQAAYDRLQARYEESAILAQSGLAALRVRSTPARRRPPPAVWWTAAAAAGVVIAAGALTLRPWSSTIAPASQRYASGPNEIRTVSIAPGVTAVLDANTVLSASTGERARLVLERGRARIDTAHPLDVRTEQTTFHADQAAFDLRREGDRVEVAALRGAVQANAGSNLLRRARTRIEPGQRLVLRGARTIVSGSAPARDRDWPTGLLFFDETPLDQVLAEANRYGAQKIRLSDPKLRSLRVNGALKVTDHQGLARALAAALGLNVDSGPGGDLVLTRAAA